MFQRPHLQIITKRQKEPRRFIQVILGPRQVGKTTLIHQYLEKYDQPYHFASADAVGQGQGIWLEQQWDLARKAMDQAEVSEGLLVIDEIQKISNWSELVKLLWDNDTRQKRNLKVILLGSSRLLLQQGLTESLAGRFETIPVGHWSYAEMKEAFGWDVDQYVWFGGYPGSAGLIQNEDRWKSYVRDALIETSISKDVLQLTRVDKPALLRQLFELGCLYSGQIISFNKILGQMQDAGNTTTLTHYLRLLDTAGLLTGLHKYSPSQVRKRSSIPKFQVYNTALISSHHQASFSAVRSKPDAWGRLVESAIGAHILNESHRQGFELYYWRDGHEEVDFVIEGKKVVGLEVKSGAVQSLSGLEAFKTQFNYANTRVIGKNGIPWEQFLLSPVIPETI